MIKHNSASSVFSPFNPIIALNSKMRKRVNEGFIKPILEQFFSDKRGLDSFTALDPDKLKTEIEFDTEENLVKSYVYKELMNDISKQGDGQIAFKPRYVVSFDSDLTEYEQGSKKYPFKKIFNDNQRQEEPIKYGVMRLGNAPILYFIYVDLQDLIRYIKTLPNEAQDVEQEKIPRTPENRRNDLIDELVVKQYRKYQDAPDQAKPLAQKELTRLISLSKEKLQGEGGSLRVNLSWNTTDDLDLIIETEFGKIDYQNKILEYNGSIGKLDIDANASGTLVSNPQENVNWDKIPPGKHSVKVNFYSDRENKKEVHFTVFIDNGDESRIYNGFVNSSGMNKTRNVAEFELVNNVLVFKELIN